MHTAPDALPNSSQKSLRALKGNNELQQWCSKNMLTFAASVKEIEIKVLTLAISLFNWQMTSSTS